MIQDTIKRIVDVLTDEGSSPASKPFFVHGHLGWQNLVSDEINYGSVVFLDEPIRSNDSIGKGAYLEETYLLTIAFLEKSELDWTPEQHLPAIGRQRRQRSRFIHLLKTDSTIRGIGNISTTDLYNVFDVNLTGCSISISVTPINDLPKC